MGDMPIYVGYHSADVWANSKHFLLVRYPFMARSRLMLQSFCIAQLTIHGSTRIEVAFLFWLVVFPLMPSVKLVSFGTG